MYIIVVGGGKVGYHLTKALMSAGREVLLIERRRARAEEIKRELGSVTLMGDGCEVRILDEAGANRAEVLLAVTGDDEDNLVACQLAKHHFGVPRTVARINNPKNEAIFYRLGVDTAVSATDVILSHIEERMPGHALIHLMTLNRVGVSFVEARLAEDSPAVGKTVHSLGVPHDALLSLIIRNGQAVVPYGQTELRAGDEVIAVTSEASEAVLRRLLLGEARPDQ